MKHVRRTKEPATIQMLNMASNLTEKFNKPTKISIDAWRYTVSSDNISLSFYMYVQDIYHDMAIPSWKDLQDKYFELMEATHV